MRVCKLNGTQGPVRVAVPGLLVESLASSQICGEADRDVERSKHAQAFFASRVMLITVRQYIISLEHNSDVAVLLYVADGMHF